MTRNENYYMITMKLFFIVFLVLDAFDAATATELLGDVQEITIDESPTTITLSWPTLMNEGDDGHYNLSMKEHGRSNYTSLFVRSNVSSYEFKRPYKCFRGEFLLVSRTAIRRAYVKPKLPEKVTIDKFVIVYNWYDEVTNEIMIDLKWSNKKLSNWSNDDVKQQANIHVIECGDGVNAVIPQLEFTSTTSGRIVLPIEYGKALTSSLQPNPKCLFLITIISPIRICDISIPIQERSDQTSPAKNSVVVDVDCESTVGLKFCNNIAPTAGPGVFVPSPKCDPKNLTIKWLSETKLKIEWIFEQTKNHAVQRYIVRYGKNNQKFKPPSSQDSLMDILTSMDVELGRLKTNENETNTVIALENSSINAYKISICALFDGNSDGDINWNIVPTYTIERPYKLISGS